ncbi:MAG: hypothetical protein JKY50_11005 [Oleispira sp.]|nr:hypothetical protein [Oleispira sp.]MBL4880601.1 hypothetical protein [Oleispira sp.]
MKNTMKKNTITQLTLLSSAALLLVLIVISQPSNAYDREQSNNSKQSSERRGPPPAAFTACEGKNEGNIAQFETPRGEILTGTCEEPRGKNAGKLVLRPDKRRTPPAEAFTACEGKNTGDTSQFENQRGDTLKGTCEESKGKLVLRPERFTR